MSDDALQAANTTDAETIARGRQALENLRLAGRTSYELKQWCDQVAAALKVLEDAAKDARKDVGETAVRGAIRIQEILDERDAAVSRADTLTRELQRARVQIKSEHAYKASLGGSPCVCEFCAALAAATPDTQEPRP